MFPELTGSDRYWMRVLWLKVQNRRCAICDVAHLGKSPYGHGWVLSYVSGHGKPYCWNCVAGVVCRQCMLYLSHLKAHSGNLPRQDVNGMDRFVWAERAQAHLDLGVCVGASHGAGEERESGPEG